MNGREMNIHYLDTDEGVKEYLSLLDRENIDQLALDIEAEYNLHQYGEKLCLIQVFDGKRSVVIDPFCVNDESITALFCNPDIRKIMYDCSSDQTLILKQYGKRLCSIIDLRPASDLLDLPRQDLGSVLEDYLGVRKSRNYQKYNWTRRPVDEGALEYAMNDVIYLFMLKDKMFEELNSAGVMDEYLERNRHLNTKEININRKPGFFRKPMFVKLKNDQKNRVKKIFYIREKYAREYNVPPNHIFSNDNIIRVGTGKMHVRDVKLYRSLRDSDRENLSTEISNALKQA